MKFRGWLVAVHDVGLQSEPFYETRNDVMVQYYTASSLDGFLATTDDSLDWLLRLGDVSETSYPSFIAGVGAMVMGSSTYQWLIDNVSEWPYDLPVWVFTSRELPVVDGSDVRLVSGDVRSHHAGILEESGGRNIWIVGGGDLAGQYHDAGLLDEIIVTIAPVTLGNGKPLFPRHLEGLRLESMRRYDPFVEVRYVIQRP